MKSSRGIGQSSRSFERNTLTLRCASKTVQTATHPFKNIFPKGRGWCARRARAEGQGGVPRWVPRRRCTDVKGHCAPKRLAAGARQSIFCYYYSHYLCIFVGFSLAGVCFIIWDYCHYCFCSDRHVLLT